MSKDAFHKRHWRVIAAVAVSVVLAVVAARFWMAPATVNEVVLSPELKAMRLDTGAWHQREQDASHLFKDLDQKRVAAVGLTPGAVLVSTVDGGKYFVADAFGVLPRSLYQRLDSQSGFELAVVDGSKTDLLGIIAVLPSILILILLGFLVARPLSLVGNKFQFAKRDTGIRFADIIGAHEAKSALQEVVAYLQEPDRFGRVGARPPRGVLLSGPPGTGKTLMAKALAGECGINFIAATGSDFSSMFVGMGIMRVKSLFQKARKHSPCIVFIDEIDGIGRRTAGERDGAAESEGNRIINQLLAELDGFANDSGIIVIGATNFADRVDPALSREGRFDRKIQMALPTVADRQALFELYGKKINTAADIDHAQLGRLTIGLAPAAIAYIVNHAALVAAKRNAGTVEMNDFLEAIEVCRIGELPLTATTLTEAERERIAVHEAGHALAGYLLEVGNVEKVTIVPRGQSLGVTLITPANDQRLYVRSFLENRIKMLLAGRAAEMLRYKECSSGAAQDLKEASKIALSMVATLGLGDEGNLFSLDALSDMNLNADLKEPIIRAEHLLQRLGRECADLLRLHRSALDAIAQALLDKESIDGDELAALATVECVTA
jgi:cell division protease FtsH